VKMALRICSRVTTKRSLLLLLRLPRVGNQLQEEEQEQLVRAWRRFT
jgi:hypothetical protein